MRSIGGGNSVGIDRGRGRRRAGVDERAGVRRIGAHVDQPLDADAEKIAVRIERQRAREPRATAVVIAQDAFGARSNPLDRAPKQLRRQKQSGEFRINLVAHAEATADVVSVNANLVRRDTSNVSEAAADVGHPLGWQVNVIDAGSRIERRNAGLRLHRIAGNTLRVECNACHMRGVGERRLDRRERTVLVFHGEVARHVRVQYRRAGRERCLRVDHSRQIAIVDHNALGAVLGRGLVLRDNKGHRLAHEAHALVRQCMAMRQLEGAPALALHEHDRRRCLEGGLDDVGTGQNSEHARHRQRRAGVDRNDFGMGVVAAQEPTMRLPFEVPVGGVFALPRYESKILAPALFGCACVHVINSLVCWCRCLRRHLRLGGCRGVTHCGLRQWCRLGRYSGFAPGFGPSHIGIAEHGFAFPPPR